MKGENFNQNYLFSPPTPILERKTKPSDLDERQGNTP